MYVDVEWGSKSRDLMVGAVTEIVASTGVRMGLATVADVAPERYDADGRRSSRVSRSSSNLSNMAQEYYCGH